MGADRFKKQWRYPDHKSWVHARINSHNKKNFLRDLKLVLTRCGVLDRFKEGPFGQYLDAIQPIRVHGMLIYNLLKRQVIIPEEEKEEEKDDQMWFGLGEKKARFGREEFCLCSGLNMGTLPEGFQEKEKVSEESILTRYFVDENPSIELLEASFNRLTEPSEGDDALKMGYLLMVSQFFGMDEARIAIPSWVLSLVEDIDAFESFPWGSYIFDVTLCCLKNAADKHLDKLRGNGEKKEENEGPKNKKRKKKEEENKEEKKKKPKKGKKKKTDNQQAVLDNEENTDDSKCFTFHVYGFLLAFQVWAVERICRLEGKLGLRQGTGFPRFKNWNFNTRVLKVESFFSTTMALFPWRVSVREKSSAYYKSLMLQDVVKEDHDDDDDVAEDHDDVDAEDLQDAMEEGNASIHQSKTTPRFIGSRKSDEPSSKKRLFDGGDVETPKSKIKTSVPYTIPELYTSIAQLVTQKIKESEERMKSWISEEIGKIAPKKREKDLDEGRASSHKPVDDMVSPNLSPLHNFDDGEKLEKDLNKEVGEEVEKAEVEKAEVEKGDDKDDTGIVVGKEGGLDNVVGESYGSAKHAINLDDFPSPCVNVVLPNPDLSVIFMNAADPRVCYKNNDNIRARRRSKYLDSPYTDPMPMAIPKKRKITKDSSDCEKDNFDRFVSFLKSKDDTRVFTGQAIDMNREQFNELMKPTKWLSNLHIDSFLDILWKRRRSNGEVSVYPKIGLVPTAFFAHLKLKWEGVKKLLDSERLQNNNPVGFEQKEVKKNTKKNTKKKKDLTPTTPAVPIWEEYPEFDPLSFQPDDDTLNYVSGSDLLYPQPWWTMESVLVPCNTGDHWVLCQVFLKEGKVIMYDSFCDRNGKTSRLKDIPGLLYLLPAILKHANYYEHMKMSPHTSPFTAENIEPAIIPQQNDGYSCGAFVCKYAELLVFGFPLSDWKGIFGQKDIPTIRQAIALDIFVNGELC